jgi:hypothetical protein
METRLEHILINSHKSELISFMESHPGNFGDLIQLALSNKGRYSWRAAWLLWSCMSPNDKRLRKHIPKIIDVLPGKTDSQQRELLMVLQRMVLDKGLEDCLFQLCTTIWKTTDKNPSLRYNALKMIVKIAKRSPGLYRKITPLARPLYLDSLSGSVRKSISRMMEDLH